MEVLLDDNQDLVERYEDLLQENDDLHRQLGSAFDEPSVPDGKYRSTPRSHPRRTWEELDERESTRSTTRNRSIGQRSAKSAASSSRRFGPNSDEEEVRRTSGHSARKSSGGLASVAFEAAEEVISVPVTGAMRPSRSRVSTPFFSEEAVNKMTQKAPQMVQGSSDDSGGDRHSSVNFERDVHVVEVPFGEEAQHSRSVRGRIATPFIRDIPTREDGGTVAESTDPLLSE